MAASNKIKYLHLLLLASFLLAADNLLSQNNKEKVLIDQKKKFVFTDTAAITASYIEYFGDQFQLPELTTIDGKKINSSDLAGKTVVYNFWFVACPPCVAEIPALNRLVEKYSSDSTVFIAITFDDSSRVKKFLEKMPFQFEIASMPMEQIQEIKKITYYPFTAIVNKRGKLSFAMFGRPKGRDVEEVVFRILDGRVGQILTD